MVNFSTTSNFSEFMTDNVICVESFTDVEASIKDYEINTSSKFCCKKKEKLFGKEYNAGKYMYLIYIITKKYSYKYNKVHIHVH